MSASYLGEVVSSSLSMWSTQAWQWDNYPEFGSVICLQDGQIDLFGVVYCIRTGSDDPVRQAFAYQKTTAELQQEQPQIFEFLKTDFSAAPICFRSAAVFTYAMPPRPPKLHTFVRMATKIEMLELLNSANALHALFAQYQKIEYFEELLLAFLRYLANDNLVSRTLLLQVTEQLSLVTANDYRRLKMFMDRVGQIDV